MAEKQEGPTKKSQHLKEKRTTEPARTKSPQPMEQSQDSSDSRELPDMSWTQTWKIERRFMECQLRTDPHIMLGSLTMKTIQQSMRPEPGPGNVPQGRSWRDDG